MLPRYTVEALLRAEGAIDTLWSDVAGRSAPSTWVNRIARAYPLAIVSAEIRASYFRGDDFTDLRAFEARVGARTAADAWGRFSPHNQPSHDTFERALVLAAFSDVLALIEDLHEAGLLVKEQPDWFVSRLRCRLHARLLREAA
jgi:hypothetical protein